MHEIVFDRFQIYGESYEHKVEKLMKLYLDLMKQTEQTNREAFEQELYRVLEPTN